jgi:hypothetical protein
LDADKDCWTPFCGIFSSTLPAGRLNPAKFSRGRVPAWHRPNVPAPDLIVEMRFGAHLYGTDTPESDLDVRGVYIPEAGDILRQRVKPSATGSREKDTGGRNRLGDVDLEYHSLQRYLALLAARRTVAIDMLIAPDIVTIRPQVRAHETTRPLASASSTRTLRGPLKARRVSRCRSCTTALRVRDTEPRSASDRIRKLRCASIDRGQDRPVSNRPRHDYRAFAGAPGRSRTCDPRIRSPMLYPTELQARQVVTIHEQAHE